MKHKISKKRIIVLIVPHFIQRVAFDCARRNSICGANCALVGRCSDVPPAHHSLQLPFESLLVCKEKLFTGKPVKSFLVRPEGFDSRRAPRLGRS